MRAAFGASSSSTASLPLGARLKRACRDGSADVRHIYVAVRKTRAIFRDRGRRAALRTLPATPYEIRERTGFLILATGALSGVGPVVEQARQGLAVYDRDRPPAGKNKKRFLVNVLHADTLTLESPVIRFALRHDILAIVSRYLRLVPLLTAVKVFHSDTVDGVPTSSQLYHCDGDDLRQVKIFIYCSDVEPQSGPLTVLDAASTSTVLKSTRYTYDRRLSDDDVRVATRATAARPVLGPCGTVAFVDTSRCLHFGSRVAPGAPPRLVTMLQYSTPYSFMLPHRYRDAVPFRRLLHPSLTEIQRLVLGE